MRANRNYPGRLKWIRLGFFSFMMLAFCCFLVFEGFMFLERRFRPAILSIAVIKANALAIDAINRAILENVAEGIFYQDLIYIKEDEEGKIVVSQVNTMEVNRILAETTVATQNALTKLEKKSIEIPLGEALDSYLLATYGPKISVRIVPLGRVNTKVVDVFEDAGINQVRHKIYLDVQTEVRIVIPFIASTVEVNTTVPIADTIYPGEVPDTVINLHFPSYFEHLK